MQRMKRTSRDAGSNCINYYIGNYNRERRAWGDEVFPSAHNYKKLSKNSQCNQGGGKVKSKQKFSIGSCLRVMLVAYLQAIGK